ncbi:MAG: class III signal peptide-containing protein [Candidatus Omnitrophica bacterium]|nr:class III signal peptide-containing protein [Candidatus Omnitrophota bacterium]MBI5023700.1 class III signal peptide-containing protein [Candidatus Omnitrophota bacterium]
MLSYNEPGNREGQSTVEYILIVAGVLVAVLVFLSNNGIFQNALNATYNTNINSMLNMAGRILQ